MPTGGDTGGAAEWFSAGGTIAATAIALYFGLRGRGERLTIGFSVDSRKFAMFVVNARDRPVHIEELELELGRWRPTQPSEDVDLALLLTLPNRTPDLVPPRETRIYRAELGEDSSYLAARVERAWRARFKLDRGLYLVVITGEQARIRRRIPDRVLAAVLEHGARANKR